MKQLVKTALYASGALRAVQYRNRKLLRIFTYHHFSADTASGLAAQCEHLMAGYTPVSMSEAAKAVHSRAAFPDNSVVITVDDGYRDFFLHAYPVFKKYSIPAIVYLISDFLDGRLWPWWNEVSWAFENTPHHSFTLGNGETLHLGVSTEQRETAAEAATEWLKTVPNQTRLEFMRRLPDLLQVTLPLRPPARWEPLTWDEVRTMAANGIEFGCHSKTHPIMSRVETDVELKTEIRVCQQRVTEELGRAPAHFAYPNGQPQDVGKRVRDMVAACGFQTAVSTTRGFNALEQDPHYLKRLSMEAGNELRSFRVWTAGIGV